MNHYFANQNVLESFQQNNWGRDFVVGDIHGMFSLLDSLLEAVQFNQKTDRLFSVGDLIDRGPESQRCCEYLGQPWFNAIRGNHEDILLREHEDHDMQEFWCANGGQWFYALDKKQQQEIYQCVRQMPLAFKIDTAQGKVGLLHAEIPKNVSWASCIESLEKGDKHMTEQILWGRSRLSGRHREVDQQGVAGIDRLICGHTPINEIIEIGNLIFIDTGAVYAQEGLDSAALSLVQIQPELKTFSLSSVDRQLTEIPLENC